MTFADEWPTIVDGPYFQDWHNLSTLNTEPLTPQPHRHWWKALGQLVGRGLAAWGRSNLVEHDGLIFTPWGAVLKDGTTTVPPSQRSTWAAPYAPKRIPAPPWPGWEYVPFRDELTGWPGYRLVKVLPEGCADCE